MSIGADIGAGSTNGAAGDLVSMTISWMGELAVAGIGAADRQAA